MFFMQFLVTKGLRKFMATETHCYCSVHMYITQPCISRVKASEQNKGSYYVKVQ